MSPWPSWEESGDPAVSDLNRPGSAAAMASTIWGTLGILPVEVLVRIFFKFCPAEVSNSTIQSLSSYFQDVVSKYAPPPERLVVELCRAGVAHCFGPDHGFRNSLTVDSSTLLVNVRTNNEMRPVVPFVQASLPRPGGGRTEWGPHSREILNRQCGAADFIVPGIPASALSRLATSHARLELVSFNAHSSNSRLNTLRSAEEHWVRVIESNLADLYLHRRAMSPEQAERAAAAYRRAAGRFCTSDYGEGDLLVLSFPLLGSRTMVHFLMPMKVGLRSSLVLYALPQKKTLVSTPNGVRFMIRGEYAIDLSGMENPLGFSDSVSWGGRHAPLRFSTIGQTTEGMDALSMDEATLAARKGRLKGDYRRYQICYRTRFWTADDWVASTAYGTLSLLRRLSRAFMEVLTDRLAPMGGGPPGGRLPLTGPRRWVLFARASLLAELVYNTIVAPDTHRENCATCAEQLGFQSIPGVGYLMSEDRMRVVFDRTLGRICSDLRPALWGGRLQLAIGHVRPEPGADLSDFRLRPVSFWLVLDGTRCATLEEGRVVFSEWRLPDGYIGIWTGQLQFNRGASLAVADYYARAR